MGLKIVFFGTGRLGQPLLEQLIQSQHQIVGIVTQPERSGPGHHHHRNYFKLAAERWQIPCIQPTRIKSPEAHATLASWQPDLQLVVAYGQIIPQSILTLPPLGTINVHASLLPKYRGASPIQAAILQGESETGISIIRLVPALDAGPILGVVRTPIDPQETAGELEARLSELAIPLTLDVLQQLEEGTATLVEQDHTQATYAPRLSKHDGLIAWHRPAEHVLRHVRAMQPWPGPYTFLHQANRPPLRLQLLKMRLAINIPMASEQQPGRIIGITRDSIIVRTGTDPVEVVQVHPEGKRAMSCAEFLRGRHIQPSDYFA